MEYLFGMLCIGGIAGIVLAFWFAAKASKKKDEAKANAPELLDQLFNGDAVVTYTAGFAALDVSDVIKGAIERGYVLAHQGEKNSYGMVELVFTKASEGQAGN